MTTRFVRHEDRLANPSTTRTKPKSLRTYTTPRFYRIITISPTSTNWKYIAVSGYPIKSVSRVIPAGRHIITHWHTGSYLIDPIIHIHNIFLQPYTFQILQIFRCKYLARDSHGFLQCKICTATVYPDIKLSIFINWAKWWMYWF